MPSSGGGPVAAPPIAGTPGGAVPPAADPLAVVMAKIEQFGNPATPTTAQDMIAIAQEAAALFISLPEIEKRQKLREIEGRNKTMKELITSMMSEQRGRIRRDAYSQAMNRQQGHPPM